MENIALSDSNDDLTKEITDGNNQSLSNLRITAEQHVTSELQDAANTDVTKGRIQNNHSYSFYFQYCF